MAEITELAQCIVHHQCVTCKNWFTSKFIYDKECPDCEQNQFADLDI